MKPRTAISVSIILLLIGLPFFLILKYLDSRPAWELSARNSTHGVIVEVFKANQNAPTYSFQLDGRSIQRDINRATRQELPSDVGTTTFYDDTFKPGRWTIEIDGIEVDIMERAAIVNGNEEVPPRE